MTVAFDDLPRGRFACILADPPWHFETWSDKGRGRSPKYSTMTLGEICELPVYELATRDSVLFLWVVWPMLEHGLQVIERWGFTYKTCGFAWMKTTVDAKVWSGTGFWTRANSEVCLLATRGQPKRLNPSVKQGIIEQRREHSRKPECVHQRIERLVSGPYLELFARQRRRRWTAWGDDVDRFAGKDA